MAPHGHVVSFYDSERDAVAEVAAYVIEGLSTPEPVLVVATDEHLVALETALRRLGRDSEDDRRRGRLVTRDARATLASFVVDGSLDADLFRATVGPLLDEVRGEAVGLRVFGEMVALLWDEGDVTGALALEAWWNDLAADRELTLLCAYPHSVLDRASLADVGRICALHASVLPPTSYLMPGQETEATLDQRARAFLPVTRAVPALRRFVSDTLRAWGLGHLVPDAVVVTSEMATNAISHAVSPFHARLTRAAGGIRIAIEDVGPGVAAQRFAADDDVSGRGILIVDSLADRWGISDGVDVDGPGGGLGEVLDGKVVWAEFSA